jgi:hypothetical protein
MIVAATLSASAVGAFAGGTRPTAEQLDEGLLTTDDLIKGFEETDRRPLDALSLANDTRGPCNGPNSMAHAADLDDGVVVVTAAFGTETGGSVTEDVFAFAKAKQATSFIDRSEEQQKSCDSWDGQVGDPPPREITVSSVRTPKLGDQSLVVNVRIAPVSPRDTGFFGELIRQTTYARLGAVVASITYLRSIDFRSKKPGPGYPASAISKLEDVL